MEVLFWTFPHMSGKWSVAAGDKNKLECGGLSIRVTWRGMNPTHGGLTGTRWVEGKAVQQGVEPPKCPAAPDVWQTQEGGTHYTDMAIQPFQFSMANKLDPMQHTIIKYVTRFRAKNGIEDLRKAKQTIDLLIAWETENAAKVRK